VVTTRDEQSGSCHHSSLGSRALTLVAELAAWAEGWSTTSNAGPFMCLSHSKDVAVDRAASPVMLEAVNGAGAVNAARSRL